ncbi:MAG: serine hydrolase [Sporolactobacillus sp.]
MKKSTRKPRFIPIVLSLCLIAGIAAAGLWFWRQAAFLHEPQNPAHASARPLKLLTHSSENAPGKKEANVKLFEKGQAIDHELKQSGFSGTAVIINHDQVVLNKGYGMSNLRTQTRNSSQTRYYIGSMTKAITSAAFMQLRQKRWIDFDSRVSQYYPQFPNGSRISMIDLLDHVSGLGKDDESMQTLTRDQLVAKIARLNPRLRSRPGTIWSYEDTNYALLGAIMDKVCETHLKETLHAYILRHIFQPAGMQRSGFGIAGERQSNRSIPYMKRGRFSIETFVPSFSQLLGCGDVYATAWDMYCFDHALTNNQLLNSNSRQQLFARQFRGVPYTMGWYPNRRGWGGANYSSHGVLGGWNGSNAFSMDRENYIVLLSNVSNPQVRLDVLNQRIFRILSK